MKSLGRCWIKLHTTPGPGKFAMRGLPVWCRGGVAGSIMIQLLLGARRDWAGDEEGYDTS